jgi:hypothetical protein
MNNMFDTREYSLEKIECKLCNKFYARCNAPKHKITKCHQRNVQLMMNDLTDDEKKIIKNIISKINYQDLKKLLKKY